jgi:hypothetical protein
VTAQRVLHQLNVVVILVSTGQVAEHAHPVLPGNSNQVLVKFVSYVLQVNSRQRYKQLMQMYAQTAVLENILWPARQHVRIVLLVNI